MPQGMLFVLSAPSGAGKSTLCRWLAQRRDDLRVSVSCTTRPPREGEVHGQDYFFVTEEEFKKKIGRGELLEWADVHGHFYGTPRGPIDLHTAQGLHVLLNIDTAGAASVRSAFPHSVLIFIAPPSWTALEQRLRGRNQDGESVIERRLTNARAEVAQWPRYDYCVVNDRMETAVDDLLAIVRAEQCRTRRLKPAPDGLPSPIE